MAYLKSGLQFEVTLFSNRYFPVGSSWLIDWPSASRDGCWMPPLLAAFAPRKTSTLQQLEQDTNSQSLFSKHYLVWILFLHNRVDNFAYESLHCLRWSFFLWFFKNTRWVKELLNSKSFATFQSGMKLTLWTTFFPDVWEKKNITIHYFDVYASIRRLSD